MMSKRFWTILVVLLAMAGGYAALLFAPKNNGTPYRLVVEKGQGMAAVGRKLAADDKIYSRYVLVSAAYALGVHDKLTSGSYRFAGRVSTWQILQHLRQNNPDLVSVQIVEGMRFSQMRRVVNPMRCQATPKVCFFPIATRLRWKAAICRFFRLPIRRCSAS